MRRFAIVKKYEDKNLNLPERKTKESAGYDFEVAEDIVIPPYTSQIRKITDTVKDYEKYILNDIRVVHFAGSSCWFKDFFYNSYIEWYKYFFKTPFYNRFIFKAINFIKNYF